MVDAEVIGWKAKAYDALRGIHEMPAEDKPKAGPFLDELHTVIDELTASIEKLSRECPSKWSSDKQEIDGKFKRLKKLWDEAGKYHRYSPSSLRSEWLARANSAN